MIQLVKMMLRGLGSSAHRCAAERCVASAALTATNARRRFAWDTTAHGMYSDTIGSSNLCISLITSDDSARLYVPAAANPLVHAGGVQYARVRMLSRGSEEFERWAARAGCALAELSMPCFVGGSETEALLKKHLMLHIKVPLVPCTHSYPCDTLSFACEEKSILRVLEYPADFPRQTAAAVPPRRPHRH